MDNRLVYGAALAGLLAALTGCNDGVKVSSFGYDPEDSTAIIQRAIDSGAPKLVFDRQSGPWIARPLVGRSNLELVFEDGVELVAKRGEYHGIRDYLFRFECVSNVVIRGLGKKGGTFRMWKKDYQDASKYEKSEWRYALRLCGVENVLVENMSFRSSGGDGIVIGAKGDRSARRVTIRRCVCDDNHRQGISLCSGEDILIEDCVLSNTKGTPPEAGIDFEPDRANEKVSRVTLRNVVSKGNAGNGYDIYLRQMKDFSTPVSLRLENCTSIGNRYGTFVCANNFDEKGVVKGLVEFVGCTFRDSNRDAIRIQGTPAGALDVSCADCTVSNAATDVSILAGTSRQGVPDGIAFDNLTIHQTKARPWFKRGAQSYGPLAANVRGKVTVVTPDGKRETTVLDRAWVERNLPAVNGGRMPAPRVAAMPAVQDVTAVETKPGEMADLPPIALCYGAHYVLFVPKAGEVKVAGHQLDVVGNRPECTKKCFVYELLPNGKKGWGKEFKTPGFAGAELVFKAPRPGFYTFTFPNGGTRFVLDRSSVPVAVDVRAAEHIVAGIGRKPASLWFWSPGGRRVSFCSAGDEYYRFALKVTDPSGKEFSRQDVVDGLFSADLPASAPKGLWRVDFSPAKRPVYDWIRVDLSGVPGVLFLSPEKYWR